MKNNQKIYKGNIDFLRKDTFYRQRFDACPHFMAFIGEAHTSITNKSKYPYGQQTAYCRFSKNRADWYHSNTQLKHTADKMIEQLKIDENFGVDLKNITEKLASTFYDQCLSLNTIVLSNLTNDEIKHLYADLREKYLAKLFVSSLVDGFALITDSILHKQIENVLKEKKLESKTNSYFEILTAPIFISFLQKEELELLNGLIRVRNKEVDLNELVNDHQAKYFWIQNNYVKDNVLDVKYFMDRANKFLEQDLDHEIERILSIEKNKIKKVELIDNLGFGHDLGQMLALTDFLNYLQDERKKSTFWATHYFSLILNEIAKRIDCPIDWIKYSVPSEFELLVDGQIKPDDLEKRYNDCVVLWHLDEYQVITDSGEIQILDSIAFSETDKTINEIKGMIASAGKATGLVKILESSDDMGKVEDGDVIVAVMTRPDYLPAMKKAVAIVTDEGGVTCHAAIVARELKIPCIIGTKNATKILKDGDRIEVDAEKGVVTKIS